MMNKKNRVYRLLFFPVILCILMLMINTQRVYGKEKKTVVKEYKDTYTWITVGDTDQIKSSSIKKAFGLKNKKCKVVYSTNSGSCLKVSKKGVVRVKKIVKNSYYKIEKIKAEIIYKKKKYIFWCNYMVVFEYDDKNPKPGAVTPKQIKRFKKAYQTKKTNQLSKTEKKIFKKVKNAVDYSKSGKNRYEKLKRLNDWLTKNIDCPDESTKKIAHTMKGALLNGAANCDGYADAFKMCASVMGIPCEMVIGYSKILSIEGHAWNIVKLEDGKWYHIDVMFNDSELSKKYSYTTYNYFCLTDKQIKACGHRWYDRKKCNGKKYNIANYEKKYFLNSNKDFYDAVKQAVKEKNEYVFFYMGDGKQINDNIPSIVASNYVGKNIVVRKVGKNGQIETNVDVMRFRVNPVICPDNNMYFMSLYKITYLPDKKVSPITYVRNNNEMVKVLREGVANGDTVIKNVALCEEFDESGFYSPETSYALFGKNIGFSDPGGFYIPAGVGIDKKSYTLVNINVDYSGVNNRVYEVANDQEVKAALDDAIANGETTVYFYAPNYPREKLIGLTNGYSYDRDRISFIKDDVSCYGYRNPFTGESRDCFWVEVTIVYK